MQTGKKQYRIFLVFRPFCRRDLPMQHPRLINPDF
jgi:hypothetical protein